MRMLQINKGIRIGGPFDGTEHSVVYYPEDHPLPLKEQQVNQVFSKNFPEGAVYHWHEESKTWRYKGQMPPQSQEGARELFSWFQNQFPDKNLTVQPPL